MPAQPPACFFRTIAKVSMRALLLGCVVWVAAAGAGAETKRREHEVRATSFKNTNTFSIYKVRDPALADNLNRSLASLGWADERCDLKAYRQLFGNANYLLRDAYDKKRAVDDTDARRDLEVITLIIRQLPLPPGSGDTLEKRWRARHCGKFLLREENLGYKREPKHTFSVRVPCPWPSSAAGTHVLWCDRDVAFFAKSVKDAAEAALPDVVDAFRACGTAGQAQRLKDALARLSGAEKTAVPDTDAYVTHVKAMVQEYGLEGGAGLVDQFRIADRSTAQSLAGDFSVFRARRACVHMTGTDVR